MPNKITYHIVPEVTYKVIKSHENIDGSAGVEVIADNLDKNRANMITSRFYENEPRHEIVYFDNEDVTFPLTFKSKIVLEEKSS